MNRTAVLARVRFGISGLFSVLSLSTGVGHAATNPVSQGSYLIETQPESQWSQNPIQSYDPIDVAADLWMAAQEQYVNLINWSFDPNPRPRPPERYDRLGQFGRWIKDERNPNDCRTTRTRVLERDSTAPVTYTSSRNCTVKTGAWYDPYSNSTYLEADEVEIDHVVPVKNVYDNGAWAWDRELRCVYFNYMGNQLHLRPVLKRENRIKQDSGPERYMPPNANYSCEYLYSWLAIKAIWKVPMDSHEGEGIRQLLSDRGCSVNNYKMRYSEYQQQQTEIQNSRAICGLSIRAQSEPSLVPSLPQPSPPTELALEF